MRRVGFVQQMTSILLRSAVAATAVAQLLIIPAAYVVHPGCGHDGVVGCGTPAGTAGCSVHDHSHGHGRTEKSDGTSDPGPRHEHGKCPVCLVVFAAGCSNTPAADVPVAERAEITALFSVGRVHSPVPSGVLVRGPPAVRIDC